MLGLQDTKGAVGKLEIIFALLIHALACLAYLAIFSVSQHALNVCWPEEVEQCMPLGWQMLEACRVR